MTDLPAQRAPHQSGPVFGTELRRLRRARGLSLRDLAGQVHYSRGFLSKVETGKARPSGRLAQACDELLGANGDLAQLVKPPQRRRSRAVQERPVDLPAAGSIFVGRDRELAMVINLFPNDAPRTTRIVVIYGMPGVGKTEMVVQAAERLQCRYPDGCLFVDLNPAGRQLDTDTAVHHLLRRLGVPAELIPVTAEERLARYRQNMRGRQVLLVLDNPATAADVAALTAPGGSGDTLVASRRRLNALDEAHHIELAPLTVADAGTLFRRIVNGSGTVTELDPAAIDRITAACALLPLTVRIAAARLQASAQVSAEELAEQLDHECNRLPILDDGERSIADTFRTACAVLPPEQAGLFALLSLHPGPFFDRRVAALVADVPALSAARALDGLVGACLVRQTGPDRYSFHDLVRSVAVHQAPKVVPPDEVEAAVDRLLSGYLTTAQHADVAVTPDRHREPTVRPGPATWYTRFASPADAARWFEDEQDSLVEICDLALARDRFDVCWRLAYAMRDHFFRTRSWSHWIRTHTSALTAARRLGDRWAIAVTLNNLGLAYATSGREERADEWYTEALALFRELRDPYGEANTLGHLAWTAHLAGEHHTAIDLATAALDFYQASGASRNAAITLRTIALAETAVGRTDDAAARLRNALEIFVHGGLVLDEAMALNCLGDIAILRRDIHEAVESYGHGLSRAQACTSTSEQARALRGLAAAAHETGRHRAAEQLAEQADVLSGRST
ncbi:tetratricopeptide repeat protein [Micromonospora tulbaghiae]